MGEWEEGSYWHGWAVSGWRGPVAEHLGIAVLDPAEHLSIAGLDPALPCLHWCDHIAVLFCHRRAFLSMGTCSLCPAV